MRRRLSLLLGSTVLSALVWTTANAHGPGGSHGGGYHGGGYHYGGFYYPNHGSAFYGPYRPGLYAPYGYYRPYYGFAGPGLGMGGLGLGGLGLGMGGLGMGGLGMGGLGMGGLGMGGYGLYQPYYGGAMMAPPLVMVPPGAIAGGAGAVAGGAGALAAGPGAGAGAPGAAAAPGQALAQTPPPPDNAAHLQLVVPANAEVFFEGGKTTQTGPVREFISPALPAGKVFDYKIAVRYLNADGKGVTDRRVIHVRANDWFRIDFTRPSPEEPPMP